MFAFISTGLLTRQSQNQSMPLPVDANEGHWNGIHTITIGDRLRAGGNGDGIHTITIGDRLREGGNGDGLKGLTFVRQVPPGTSSLRQQLEASEEKRVPPRKLEVPAGASSSCGSFQLAPANCYLNIHLIIWLITTKNNPAIIKIIHTTKTASILSMLTRM